MSSPSGLPAHQLEQLARSADEPLHGKGCRDNQVLWSRNKMHRSEVSAHRLSTDHSQNGAADSTPPVLPAHTHRSLEAAFPRCQSKCHSQLPHLCSQLLPASDSRPISPTCSTQASPALPTCVHTGFLLSQRERGKQIQKKMHSAQCYSVMLRVS